MLTSAQKAALDKAGVDVVRLKLLQNGNRREQAMDGFGGTGNVTIGDVEDWLSERTRADTAQQAKTLLWAKVAGWASVIGIVIAVLGMVLHR
jgi:hypothetical protein